MSLLKRLLQYLTGKSDNTETSRVFLQDEELIAVIKDVAKQQSRAEEEVMAEFTKVGLNQLMAQHTGQPLEKIEKDVERDFIMDAEQAKEYGLVDEIISKHR